MTDNRFKGFSSGTIEFLKNLKANNNRQWFEVHKDDYNKYLFEPMQDLVIDLGEFMLSIDPELEVAPRVDKTISRIYRDTRFSKDKSPYKSTMWITFKRPLKDWQDKPAYFFEISADFYRYGMGFFSASKVTMDRLREFIDEKPKEFKKAISFYSKQKDFVAEGEKYKRILDEDKSDEINFWYQRKNLYFVCNRNIDNRLCSRKLADDLKSGFTLLSPVYNFLWSIKGDYKDIL